MVSCVIGTIEFTGQTIGASDWQALATPLPPRLARDNSATSSEAISIDADALRQDLSALFASYRRQLSRWSRG